MPACSPLQALPQSLAAKVEHLSQKLGDWNAYGAHQLQDVLKAGGSDLATSLQRIYCEGSLLTRFCTLDAMEQDSAAVGSFFLGLFVMATALPTAPIDYAPLKDFVCYLDSALVRASEPRRIEEGGSFLGRVWERGESVRPVAVRRAGKACGNEARQ